MRFHTPGDRYARGMDELRLPTPPPIVHAPKYRLAAVQERVHLATVEYPGPVNSLDNALASLGGLASVASSFSAAGTVPLELDLDPGNRFSHPVSAHLAQTNNIVCRVVKRTRKKPRRNAQGDIVDAGMYQIQPIAVEHRLARFRGQSSPPLPTLLPHGVLTDPSTSTQPWPTTSTRRPVMPEEIPLSTWLKPSKT